MNTTMSKHFRTGYRADGLTAYVYLNDDAPAWLRDAIREAHDGEFPNDWRYDASESIVMAFGEFGCELGEGIGEDMRHTITDYLAMPTNPELLTWAADHTGRLGYAEEYFSEYGNPYAMGDTHYHEDPLAGLRVAFHYCTRQMVDILADAWEDNADN